MEKICVNKITVYAKSKTIDRFWKECTDPDSSGPEFKIFKVFGMTEDAFYKSRLGDRDFCDGDGAVWDTTVIPVPVGVHPPDPKIDPENPFVSFRFRFASCYVPQIKAAKQIARRYECGVTLDYSYGEFEEWGGIACHYDKETDDVRIDYRYYNLDVPDYEAMGLPG
jgi:hypothetical protein